MTTVEPAVFRRHEAHIHPVILCGASIGGDSRGRGDQAPYLAKAVRGRSAFQEVLLWNSADAGLAKPVVVVSQWDRFLVAEQLADIGIAASRVIAEPSSHTPGTVAGLAMAALWLQSWDPKGLMLVQPADHAGHTPGQFHEAFAFSLFAAHSGSIVRFIVDDKPRGASDLFLIGATRYLAVAREKYPDLVEACARAFDADADDRGALQLDPALPPRPTLSVEKVLEGKIDIALRVPPGDARGRRDRRAAPPPAPRSPHTGDKYVRYNGL